MNLSQYLLVISLLVSFFHISHAQEEVINVSDVLKKDEIIKQFDVVVKKSGNYQEYKVVKRAWLDQFRTNLSDTLKTLASRLNTNHLKINELNTTISGLEESLVKTNQDLAAVTKEKDSISFFGAALTKGSYNTIIWGIIGVLLALLGFFIFKFKNSNTITLQAQKALSETEAEFEDHRRRALEREQKVMRKLQDEINKQRKAGAK